MTAGGDVGVFAAEDFDSAILATWIAGSESLQPVEWMRTDDNVEAMATHGGSLVLGNYNAAYHTCKGWLAARDVGPDGVLTSLDVAPIRGALAAGCGFDNTLRIQPTEYALPPVLLSQWTDQGTRKTREEL